MTEGERRSGRRYTTRRSVHVAEVVARVAITAGGVLTVLAVAGVCLFLLWTTFGLFGSAEVGDVTSLTSPVAQDARRDVGGTRALGSDEYGLIAWRLDDAGSVEFLAIESGRSVGREVLPGTAGNAVVTATGTSDDGMRLVVGRSDGSAQLVTVGFWSSYLDADQVDPSLRQLEPGGVGLLPEGAGVVRRTPLGQYLAQRPRVEAGPVVQVGGVGDAVRSVHRARTAVGGCTVVAVCASGAAWVLPFEEDLSFETGEVELVARTPTRLPVAVPAAGAPAFCAATDFGANCMLVWPGGRLERWALVEPTEPELVEAIDLRVGVSSSAISHLGVLLGGSTLVVGHEDGAIGAWFVRTGAESSIDGTELVLGRAFKAPEVGGGRIRAFCASPRMRVFAVGGAGRRLRAYYMTSGKELVNVVLPNPAAAGDGTAAEIVAVAFAPKGDALLLATRAASASADGARTELLHLPFDPHHAEVSWSGLFGTVWYERFSEPAYVWQSSASDDAFEPKFSLVPLVFGTLKATFYSMLIGLPLALLAAIYTSEFLRPKARSWIKPTIEVMASLPSVVLGFLAAMVVAPIVEDSLATVLAACVAVPVAVLVGANVVQMLPRRHYDRVVRVRPLWIAASLCVGFWAAAPLGRFGEYMLFGGDIRGWLNYLPSAAPDGVESPLANAAGGWVFVFLPLAVLLVVLLQTRQIRPLVRRRSVDWTDTKSNLVGGSLVVAGLVITAAIAWLLAWIAAGAVGDMREGIVIGGANLAPMGEFDPRNAMVVGFMMGFAIIPIMYTIAEDALSSVPSHLRAAALGAGATTWQTACTVVVPTAMSGLFSAMMVGLGRAVGETMIVLMAAGNTALMDLNVFRGFCTLSAALATELPEAVRGSTHYRTLFLAALVLFAITLVINSIAEAVRQRFRRRAFQL